MWTVDSDVVVLAIHYFSVLGFTELWVCLGSGRKIYDIPDHESWAQLGPSRTVALPSSHAIPGCHTVSHFLGCGKKTACSAWSSTPDLTEAYVALSDDPYLFNLESEHRKKLEHFVVIMYSKGCGLARVNEARHCLFTSGKKTPENIPPTQASLVLQHLKRALSQACFYWSQAFKLHQEIPDFKEWGWQQESHGIWVPYWTTLEDSSKAFPSYCTVVVRSPVLGTANAAELGCTAGGQHGSVGKSAVLTPLGMLELVVHTPLLPGMSLCAFLY